MTALWSRTSRCCATVLLLALSCFVAVATAADKKSLETRVLVVPLGVFREIPAASTPPVPPGTQPRFEKGVHRLPATSDGLIRYDVRSWLEARGVPMERLTAVQIAEPPVLVLRGPKEALDLVERIGVEGCCFTSVRHIEFGVQLWGYESEQAEGWRTMAEARAHAAGSLRLLDANSILTYSGNVSVGENLVAESVPKGPRQPNAPFGEGAPGSILQVEANPGPNGEDVDFQVDYEASVPGANGEPAAAVHVSLIGSVPDGKEVVIFRRSTPIGAEAKKYRHEIAIASVRLFDERGRTRAEAQAQAAQDREAELARQKALAQRVLFDLPEPEK